MSEVQNEIRQALEQFAHAAWTTPDVFFRTMTVDRGSIAKTIPYIDLGDHFLAVNRLLRNVYEPKILVRQEYEEILHLLGTDELYERGSYVIGQPGIGKTLFLVYVLLARLREGKRVAIQVSSRQIYAFFANATVTFHPLDDETPLLVPGVMALSDSNASVMIPPDVFFTEWSQVIQATSPEVSRWKEWSKQYGAQRCIMNLWNEQEIEDLADLLGLDAARMSELGTKWGLIPRTLLEFMKLPDTRIEGRINDAVEAAVTSAPPLIPAMIALNGVETGPSMIFHIMPRKGIPSNESRMLAPVVKFASPTIRDILGAALEGKEREVHIAFLRVMRSCPETRTGVANIFENWFHSLLVSGKAIPMNWYNREESLPANLCTPTRSIASTKDQLNLNLITPPFYWLPPTKTFRGIDSVIITTTEVFAFQVTLSFSHRTLQGGLDELRTWLEGETRKQFAFRVVFIGMEKEMVIATSKDWSHKLFFGTRTKRTSVLPVGWCAIDPIQLGIKYKVHIERDSDEDTGEDVDAGVPVDEAEAEVEGKDK